MRSRRTDTGRKAQRGINPINSLTKGIRSLDMASFKYWALTSLTSNEPRRLASHLFVHEYVDEGVDDGG